MTRVGCEPTTHRGPKKYREPTTHRLLEGRAEPPLWARETVGSACLVRHAPVAGLFPDHGDLARSHRKNGREFRASGRRSGVSPANGGTAASAARPAPCRSTSSRNRHQSLRCVVGSRRWKLNDALSEKSKRCVVGS